MHGNLKPPPLLIQWLQQTLGPAPLQCSLLAGDLSRRTYYRIQYDNKKYVVMDASLQQETCNNFIQVDQLFTQLGACVPKIYARDQRHGFLLLTDFGDQHYLNALNTNSADALYGKAIDTIHAIQAYQPNPQESLPQFTRALYQRELDGFIEWFIPHYCNANQSISLKTNLQAIFDQLIETALGQTQVLTHRDYHSKNLMLLANGQVGLLDFQDARFGPICYDIVSLLRDCYIDWPEDRVLAWVKQFYQTALANKRIPIDDFNAFMHGFDWVGLQRHLKCLGLFARFSIKEKQPHYAAYLPRILQYARRVSHRYPALSELADLLDQAEKRL